MFFNNQCFQTLIIGILIILLVFCYTNLMLFLKKGWGGRCSKLSKRCEIIFEWPHRSHCLDSDIFQGAFWNVCIFDHATTFCSHQKFIYALPLDKRLLNLYTPEFPDSIDEFFRYVFFYLFDIKHFEE